MIARAIEVDTVEVKQEISTEGGKTSCMGFRLIFVVSLGFVDTGNVHE